MFLTHVGWETWFIDFTSLRDVEPLKAGAPLGPPVVPATGRQRKRYVVSSDLNLQRHLQPLHCLVDKYLHRDVTAVYKLDMDGAAASRGTCVWPVAWAKVTEPVLHRKDQDVYCYRYPLPRREAVRKRSAPPPGAKRGKRNKLHDHDG